MCQQIIPRVLGHAFRSYVRMKRIVLTGFRGTGKTDTGRVLARRYTVPFIDTDALIELTTGRSIPTIFEPQ